MPVYDYVCMDCNHRFAVERTIEEFEANPIIQCLQCQSNNVQIDPVKTFIRNLNIKECNECEEIRLLQKAHHINVAPLFWQGRGRKNISLIIMGINPSVVGTPNEPIRGCDFDEYFNYYQYRNESEDENIRQARDHRITTPVRYWTICHNLAGKLLGNETPRWKNYVLMEAIHCFYNRATDLNRAQTLSVAQTCFNRHTCKMLMFLKPKMIVLLGNPPYESLKQYLSNPINPINPIGEHRFYVMTIECEPNDGTNIMRVPVLRHPYLPRGGYYEPQIYEAFKQFCDGFNHRP